MEWKCPKDERGAVFASFSEKEDGHRKQS